jgi:hypothetical protein
VIVTAGLNPSFVIADSRRDSVAPIAMGFSVTRNTYTNTVEPKRRKILLDVGVHLRRCG